MGVDTILQEYYNLRHDQNTIQIDYTGLGFKARGNLKYQYHLQGHSEQWFSAPETSVLFPSLSPGDYSFTIKAINEDGIASETPASLNFTISPPWWATWWFKTGMILLLGTIVFVRGKNIKKQQQIKHDFERKVSELSMQALQTQMNPHFIFNSLNAIQKFLTVNDKENALLYLGKFSKLIRTVFNQSNKKTISLEEEIDFLKTYLSLEDLRFNHKVDIKFNVHESIEKHLDEYHLPPLLIQPIIENAFKHGLFHKKGNKKISIEFKKVNEFIHCTITDNGVGMSKSKKLNQWKTHEHKSSGIETTRERLALIHKEHTVFNPERPFFKITDLEENGLPSGTQVEMYI